VRVLVTGAGGFIGRNVLTCLRARGVETIAVGRRKPDQEVVFEPVDLLNAVDLHLLLARLRPSHLLHLAWYVEHVDYREAALNTRWLDASIRLAKAFCEIGGQRLVIAGSSAEYDSRHGYCSEDLTPVGPVSLYGIAKDATRRMTMAICDRAAISCAWARIFIPYGPGECRDRLIPSLIAACRGRKPPFPVDIETFRDFVHVEDVAEGLVVLLERSESGIFNISSGQPLGLGELVRRVAGLLGARTEPFMELAKRQDSEPRLLVGSNLKLTSLGWRCRVDLDQGLGRYEKELRT